MIINGKIKCDHRVGDPVQVFLPEYCPRCKGRGWYGGIAFGNDGKIQFLQNRDYLPHQVEKILTENLRNTGYGFDRRIINGIIEESTLLNIKQEIVRVMTYFKNLQRENQKNG